MDMVITPTDFVLDYVLHVRRPDSGRCYILVEPTGKKAWQPGKTLWFTNESANFSLTGIWKLASRSQEKVKHILKMGNENNIWRKPQWKWAKM